MASKYQHLFFDLDNTLWDFEKNSEEALVEIFEFEQLEAVHKITQTEFIQTYKKVNSIMWKKHREGKVNKESLREQRFILVFDFLGIKNDALAGKLNEEYIKRAMSKKHLMPHTIEVLEYLKDNYALHIITNGFEESQKIKLSTSGIHKYFTHIITSESVHCTKPNRKIFQHALKLAGAKRKNSLMVGDNLDVDIIGARRAGIDQVFISPEPLIRREKITHHFTSLLGLKGIL